MEKTIKITVILLAFCFAGCKCQPEGLQRDSVRTEYKLDSVYIYKHDSIFRDRWREGDTIYIQIEKWQTRYKDKIVLQHDTISISDVQTIVKVEKQKGFVWWLGLAAIIFLCIVAVYGVAKVVLKFYGIRI